MYNTPYEDLQASGDITPLILSIGPMWT